MPIELKIAFDSATMTSGKRVQQEIGTFEIMGEDETLADMRSPAHAHQWLLYFGAEDKGNSYLDFFLNYELPRKPHPNGLEAIQCCTFVANPSGKGKPLPYALDIIPHFLNFT